MVVSRVSLTDHADVRFGIVIDAVPCNVEAELKQLQVSNTHQSSCWIGNIVVVFALLEFRHIMRSGTLYVAATICGIWKSVGWQLGVGTCFTQ